jgi:hypothetical protein
MRSFPYVLGPNGSPLTPSDLPQGRRARWVPSQKAVVVIAVQSGFLSLDAACKRYALSEEEFRTWERAYAGAGLRGLRRTQRRVSPQDIPVRHVTQHAVLADG